MCAGRLLWGLSVRNLEEMMAERGVEIDHGVIVRFVQFLAVLVGKTLSINELLASSIRVFNSATEPCWAPLCAWPAPYLTRKVREPLNRTTRIKEPVMNMTRDGQHAAGELLRFQLDAEG